MSERVGYVGLGIMGMGMARNLVKAGFPLSVWNRTASKAEALAAEGATARATPAEVAAHSDIIVICVSDTPDVEAVLLGENGIIHGAQAGSLVIDCSTISPQATQVMAEKLAAKGIAMLDAPVSGGSGAVEKPKRQVARTCSQPSGLRQIELLRRDEAQGLGHRADAAHIQQRVVGPRRARTDQHRIVARAHEVDHTPRFGSGDPLAFADPGCDAPVEACRELQRHHRPAAPDPAEKTALQVLCLGPEQAGVDRDPGRAQHRVATPRDARVGIFQGADDPRHARHDQRLGAGRCLAMVGAGFKADIGRGATRVIARRGQGHPFGMGAPAGLGPSPPDDAAALDDDATNRRIGPNRAQPPRTKTDREGQKAPVRLGRHSSPDCDGRSSDTNLSKSSAAWKFL